jgi:hypothetical protein
MKPILTILTLIAISGSAHAITLDAAAKAVHVSSAGKLIKLTSPWADSEITVEDSGSKLISTTANGLMEVANKLCDLNRPWVQYTDTGHGYEIATCTAK